MTKFIICIGGASGTGKSSFAQYLSNALHIPMISKDEIKETLFDTVGFRSRTDKVKLGISAMHLMIQFANTCLKNEVPIILENNFENETNPLLLECIVANSCKVITVVFEAHESILYDRIVKRDQSPSRHLGHIVNT